jgi:hypothetical protein
VSAAATAFTVTTRVGTVGIERLDPRAHLSLLHAWVTSPHAVYWQMQGASEHDVLAAYLEIDENPHHHAWLGRLDGEPLFLAETYDPARSELAPHHDWRAGDIGMHLLVAPPQGAPRSGTTSAVMGAVMRFVLADPGCERVVVEPDERNDAIAEKNRQAGFVVIGPVQLEGKTGVLSIATREDFDRSELGRTP